MVMEIVFSGGKRVDALYRGFRIGTDQPRSAGGEASAPTPFDLFLASLGTCSGFCVLEFCRERGIPTEDAKLTLHAEKDATSGMLSRITIELDLSVEFPRRYEEAVIRSAELCAVKKHFENPPQLDIRLKVEGEPRPK